MTPPTMAPTGFWCSTGVPPVEETLVEGLLVEVVEDAWEDDVVAGEGVYTKKSNQNSLSLPARQVTTR